MAMIITHVSVGMLIGLVISILYGDSTALLVLIGGFAGGFPDIDALSNHRKTLHFPVFSLIFLFLTLLSLTISFVFLKYSHYYLIIGLTISISLVLHYILDYLAYGSVVRPWEDTKSEQGIYNHLKDEWIESKRFYYYGSKLDLLILFSTGVFINLLTEKIIIRMITFIFIFLGFVFYFKKDYIANYL